VGGAAHTADFLGSPPTFATGVLVATRLYPEFSAHLMRVTETADWLEWQDSADPVIDEPFELKDGVLIFPDRPGSSIECNEEAIDRFGYDALADGLSPVPLIGTVPRQKEMRRRDGAPF